MKILNLNLGIKIDNLKEVIGLLEQHNPDIATFQEAVNCVDKECFNMFKSKNELEKLYPNNHFAPLFIADAMTKNGVKTFDFGGKVEQGSLLVSKYKILQGENQFYHNEYRYLYDITDFYETDWCRSLQNCVLDINGTQCQILNVHGIWNRNKTGSELTHKQTEFILSKIRNDMPCILIGDFNLLPVSEDIKIISSKLTNLIDVFNVKTTRPKEKGNLVCDYIFVNNKVKVNSFEVLQDVVSDHLALIMDFDI